LLLAVQQLRLRQPSDPWLIPVRFDDCQIPDRDLGAGRTLESVQRADLFGDRYDVDGIRLIVSIQRILGRNTPRPAQPTATIGQRRSRNTGTARTGKRDSPVQGKDQRPSPSAPQLSQVPQSAPRDGALTVHEYSTKGPAYLVSFPPSFADERYHRLARAAVQTHNLEAVLELIRISQSQQHTIGEISWLSLAASLGHRDPRALAEAYRRAGAGDEAKHFTILAWMDGDDDAGAEVGGYPEDLRERIIRDKIKSTSERVWERAAKNGSEIAGVGLGQRAVEKGDYRRAVSLLKRSAKDGNPEAMYLLGKSLLAVGRRNPGRQWPRKAAEAGNRDAKLRFAQTSITQGPMRALVRETVDDFDAGRLDVADSAALMFDLASAALDRGLHTGAVQCLRRAASVGSSKAMLRLSKLYLDRYELPEAEQQLRAALNAGAPHPDQRVLMFRLASEFARAQREEAAQYWLEEAARAGHDQAIEISAGLDSLQTRPRRKKRPRRDRPRLPPHFNLISAIAQDLYLRQIAGTIIGAVGTVMVLGGVVFGIWEIISPVTNSVLGTIGYIILGIVAVPIGVMLLAGALVTLGDQSEIINPIR
jgi:TPR repeat protein